MGKLYWKIFFGFWITTILMVLGTNLIIHGLDLAPGRHFGPRQSPHHRGVGRLLYHAVRDTINHTESEVVEEVRKLPPWAIRHLYIINEDNRDVLGRPLPEGVKAMLVRLTPLHPFERLNIDKDIYFGRFVVLADGSKMRMIATSNLDDRTVLWQLFFKNFLPILLVAILISGTLCFFLTRRVTSPIKTLREATKRIAGGDFSVRVQGLADFKGRDDDIAELGRDFDHMTTRVQQSMAEQKRLIKDVSHELRSPLMRMQFALGLAQQRSNGAVDTELNKIKESADYLNDIISSILSLPINENESWDLNDTVDLKVLLETLMDDYQSEADAKQVTLAIDCPSESLVATHGNSLVGVFENLLRNALHYTASGSLITTRVMQDGDNFIVTIADQGPGLSEEQLTEIFKPFYRTDEARDRASGGYGLGLAIAQRTVDLHGGSINAQNRPDGGLCVTVTLPLGNF